MKWKIKLRPDLEKGAGGNIQVLDMQQYSQHQVWVVNIYNALRQSDKTEPARYADWAHIINANTILAGDVNAHRPRWNSKCTIPIDYLILEGLMDDYDLRYVGDGQETHRQTGQQQHSVLDMVFTTMELQPHTMACRLDDPAYATLSDHEVMWWVVDTGCQTEEPNLIT
jgi:endonuclease/exonuclease/phosphatase family metal-dependent hydrolase